VVIEVIPTQVREQSNAKLHRVDTALVDRVRRNFHRDDLDTVITPFGQTALEIRRLRSRTCTRKSPDYLTLSSSGHEDVAEHPRRSGFPISASHANDEKVFGRMSKTRCRYRCHRFPNVRNNKLRNVDINAVVDKQRHCSGGNGVTGMEVSVIRNSGDTTKE
jgi:hypothetical protein